VTCGEWRAFSAFREAFRERAGRWNADAGDALRPLQAAAACADTPPYPVETPVVYNTALDAVREDARLALFIVSDNPGKTEQLRSVRRYLAGQAGKLAEGFFRAHPELGVDFRQNAVILNKTPVHTAKTAHLRGILRGGGDAVRRVLAESQRWMASETARLHQAFPGAALWITGYGELRAGGVFAEYRAALRGAYARSAAWDSVFVFQHFSMNRFAVDLKRFAASRPAGEPLRDTLAALGALHRGEIFGGA